MGLKNKVGGISGSLEQREIHESDQGRVGVEARSLGVIGEHIKSVGSSNYPLDEASAKSGYCTLRFGAFRGWMLTL